MGGWSRSWWGVASLTLVVWSASGPLKLRAQAGAPSLETGAARSASAVAPDAPALDHERRPNPRMAQVVKMWADEQNSAASSCVLLTAAGAVAHLGFTALVLLDGQDRSYDANGDGRVGEQEAGRQALAQLTTGAVVTSGAVLAGTYLGLLTSCLLHSEVRRDPVRRWEEVLASGGPTQRELIEFEAEMRLYAEANRRLRLQNGVVGVGAGVAGGQPQCPRAAGQPSTSR